MFCFRLKSRSSRSVLLGATLLAATSVMAQEGSGFLISINGDAVSGDPAIEPRISRPDRQLAQADVRIQYDGLTATPVLDLEIVGGVPASTVTLQSALNYPAYVSRGEIRLYEDTGRGAPRLVQTIAITPNGQLNLTVPDGDIYAVHRVYDDRGRYDETAPLSLTRADSRLRADNVEEGADATERRGIPVRGGAVTVSGANVPAGANVTTMGEAVRPDANGRFVIQRIVPPGLHPIDVQVNGAGQNVDLVRDINVPRADWFYVATADLTYGINETNGTRESYNSGRLSGYVNGHFASNVELTAQVDTGEGPLDEIFSTLDERDPRSVLLRVDPEDLYPTYGDDSTIVDDTPTSGKFYLRVERDNNYVMWGDYQADVQGGYLRNERTLYGLAAHWEAPTTTTNGDARASVDVYAAQPERLPQRDILLGTGGSVYFLNRQDIGIGTETVTVLVRDASTGRILSTQELVAGQDYAINYIQGVVTLAAPLSSYISSSLIVTDPGGSSEVALAVNYEYSPTAVDVDTFAYGGRVEGWVSDELRVGVTAMTEETGTGDQRALGADILWQRSANTFVSLDYAVSEGPGFTSSISADGGLVFDTVTGAGGNGDAVRLEASADLQELGLGRDGRIAGYFERRTAGFSTLDYDVTDDEELWGVTLDMAVSERLGVALYYDDYDSASGEYDRNGGVELRYDLTQTLQLAGAVEHLDRNDGTEIGQRTDAVVRLTYAPSDDAELYGYVQSTLNQSGTLASNDRIGIGGRYGFGRGWSVEGEVSDGDQGAGARILLRQERGEQDSTYFGYELDPDRELDGLTLTGTDAGRFIFGGSRDLGNGLSSFGENSYDLYGARRALTTAYGVTYVASDYMTYTGAMEIAQVADSVNGDFERHALSFGASYQDDKLTASGRIEYRREDGTVSGSLRDGETILVVSDARYQFDDARRLIFSLDASRTTGDGTIVASGDLTDLQLGYAVRPVDNEKLNVLLRYRYLEDTYGQQLASDDTPGSLQRSHVLSAEASYDLDRDWTLGAKVGFRLSQTAADTTSPWVENNAALAIVNARYHIVHNWDALLEVRAMHYEQSGTTEMGGLGAIYRQINPNLSLGVGYNFGTVSSDLTDIDYDKQGAFVNLVAQF